MITWVRHGQSTSNAGERSSDGSIVDITALGLEQAINFSNKVVEPPDLIIHTPFVRTYQTALPLIQRFPKVPVMVRNLQEFTYLDPRKCVNTNSKERSVIAKDYWSRNDPDYQDCPEVESFAQFQKRTVEEMSFIKELNYKNIYVFSHQHVLVLIRMLMNETIGLEPSSQTMTLFRQEPFIKNCESFEMMSNHGNDQNYSEMMHF